MSISEADRRVSPPLAIPHEDAVPVGRSFEEALARALPAATPPEVRDAVLGFTRFGARHPVLAIGATLAGGTLLRGVLLSRLGRRMLLAAGLARAQGAAGAMSLDLVRRGIRSVVGTR